MGYSLTVDSSFELSPNFYLVVMPVFFLLLGIEEIKEGRKVYGSLLMACFAVNAASMIQHLASVI
ncbi:hypothetical protein [Lentibacillus sp. CBA3610]|uniref:hypothetical protein n=1 Tax=Lentibacillus sp. CBA3610 TaxID=2518176 RepID=UPI00159508A8|nr:hypothetical protein [Lentibacillus sp. CBA3610]QKY70701.1 hypothetical protein Len3610_14845 [Lentibacillus sp. CBA3610]